MTTPASELEALEPDEAAHMAAMMVAAPVLTSFRGTHAAMDSPAPASPLEMKVSDSQQLQTPHGFAPSGMRQPSGPVRFDAQHPYTADESATRRTTAQDILTHTRAGSSAAPPASQGAWGHRRQAEFADQREYQQQADGEFGGRGDFGRGTSDELGAIQVQTVVGELSDSPVHWDGARMAEGFDRASPAGNMTHTTGMSWAQKVDVQGDVSGTLSPMSPVRCEPDYTTDFNQNQLRPEDTELQQHHAASYGFAADHLVDYSTHPAPAAPAAHQAVRSYSPFGGSLQSHPSSGGARQPPAALRAASRASSAASSRVSAAPAAARGAVWQPRSASPPVAGEVPSAGELAKLGKMLSHRPSKKICDDDIAHVQKLLMSVRERGRDFGAAFQDEIAAEASALQAAAETAASLMAGEEDVARDTVEQQEMRDRDDLIRALRKALHEVKRFSRKISTLNQAQLKAAFDADPAATPVIGLGYQLTPEMRKVKAEEARQKQLAKLHKLKEKELLRAWKEAQRRAASRPDLPPHLRPPPSSTAVEPPMPNPLQHEVEVARAQGINTATRELRSRYKSAAPPFATSLGELYQRDVIGPRVTPPRSKKGESEEREEKKAAKKAKEAQPLPDVPYHAFSAAMRRAYWQQRVDREERVRERQFRAELETPAVPRAPFVAPVDPGWLPGEGPADGMASYPATVERLKQELVFGPLEPADESIDDAEAPFRPQWR
ncbi:hypothetical protein DIPPA_02259 [Diplonema papillatum]|nr:hypothetical protein DIPPA_02259 [Diplonema papillatum]